MIKNQWYAVASSSDIRSGKLYHLKRLSMDLVFFRNGRGEICCVSDKCPHRGASVGRGCMVLENGKPLDKAGRAVPFVCVVRFMVLSLTNMVNACVFPQKEEHQQRITLGLILQNTLLKKSVISFSCGMEMESLLLSRRFLM